MFIQNSYCFFRTLFVIHLLSSCLFSYAELKDNQYWFDIDFSKKITKSLDMDIAHRVRYKSDELAADKNSTDFSLSYAINSKFKLSGDLRYDSRVEESEYRVGINFKFDPQISNIIPVYKIKLQKEYNNHKVEEFFIRNKFSFSIPILKQLKSILYYESYFMYQDTYFDYKKYRLSTSLEYKFNSSQTMGLFYIYKEQLKINHFEITHILGLKFEYSF